MPGRWLERTIVLMSEHQWEDHHPATDTFASSSKLPRSIRDQIVNGLIVMLFGTPFAILASLMHDRAPSPACGPCLGYNFPPANERRRRQHRSWLFSTLPRAFTKDIFALPAASSFLSLGQHLLQSTQRSVLPDASYGVFNSFASVPL
jgi:hypothetical protein